MGDPKGFHQGYHEMTYTKFGRGRSFCKNEVGGGGRAGGGLNLCLQKEPYHDYIIIEIIMNLIRRQFRDHGHVDLHACICMWTWNCMNCI